MSTSAKNLLKLIDALCKTTKLNSSVFKKIKPIREYIIHRKYWEASKSMFQVLKFNFRCYINKYHSISQTKEEELYIAHYTSIDTIYSMLSDEYEGRNPSGGLRLYDTWSLNDPQEGINFFTKIQIQKNCQWLKQSNLSATPSDSFVCSFISGKETIGDQLKYWQAYGKDGLGCSIQIKLSDGEYKSNFYRVLYGNNKKILEDIQNTLKPYLKIINFLYEKVKDKKEFEKNFYKSFDTIKFLYKNEAYGNENEYRRLITLNDTETLSITESDIKYHFKEEGPYLRRYVDDKKLANKKVLISGTKIFIGPRVGNKERMCFDLKKLCEQKNLYGPVFKKSSIFYRKVW